MKTKFNIVDIVIIFIIIAAIAVGCLFYFKSSETKVETLKDTTKIQFVIEVKNLTETAANSFKSAEGKSVTFGETASGSGTLVKAEIVDFEKWVTNAEEGTVNIQAVPDRYTARITIESDVTKSDISYTSGSEIICVGKEMPFNSFGVGAEECYIVDLSEIE